jgi:hypothetical protein
MPIDPRIAMGFQPTVQLESPLNRLAKFQQIQSGQQEQQFNALRMQEAQAAQEERNALRQLDPSSPDYQSQLSKISPSLGIAYQKEQLAARNAEASRSKAEIELKTARRKFIDDARRNLSSNPSDENIKAWAQDSVIENLYSPEEAESQAAQLLALSPSERTRVLASSGASAAELMPKPVAPPAMVAEYKFAKTPEGGGFVGSYQDFVTARAAADRAPAQPRQEPAPSVTTIVDPANPSQMIAIDARRYQGGGAGAPGVIGVSGKEPGAAIRQNKTEAGKTQLADDLDNLRQSFKTLDEMRAIPSTQRNFASNILSATAATGAGQMLGRATGTSAQVEREVINSARTRLVNSIKNATGMSAQQLNSNVELQTMLKSISDPGQPIEAALRIIDDIEKAYVKSPAQPNKTEQIPLPSAGGARPTSASPASPLPPKQSGGVKFLGFE